MKVAIVSPYSLSVPGGVQQQVIELATKLGADGHDTTVVAPGAAGIEGAVDVGGTVGIRANGAIAPVALMPTVGRRVRDALSGFDVVHVHEPLQPLVGWAALRVRGPKVLTFHADPSPLVRGIYRGLKTLIVSALRDAGVASAVSEVAESAMAHLFDDVARIPNGLAVGSYAVTAERHDHQVAFLGRPEPRKGRDLLLEAWPRVLRAIPGATLVVMGAGGGARTEGVRFTGRVTEDEKRSILAASSVFCAPNRGGESFGITVAEGMAAGCAIVASDIPAFVDVLQGTGELFVSGDADDLARALAAVLDDHAGRQKKVDAARRRVWAFDWDSVTEQYVSLYERAILLGGC